MSATSIEWTNSTWNPIVGCELVSPGCKNCYAMKMAARLERMGTAHYAGLTLKTANGSVWTGQVREAPKHIMELPLSWKKPRMIFTNSMSDLFHPGFSDETIAKVFDVMRLCPQHIFQVLTKREDRMCEWLMKHMPQPLPHVWIGVSVEDRRRMRERIPWLRSAPAAVRFLSVEPMLERLTDIDLADIDWVICGAESGPAARFCPIEWVEELRDSCVAKGVPFFFKQHVADGKKIATPELGGRKWVEFPHVRAA